ncbi:alpha/beta hydrolase [Methylobacterium planeticum]|uniref:Alpha/beta hydrolase n=1 Tax=Methylobacterium planeticum TaxID=2615211 RepID=A0A6N6N0S6_9HYPH|nr:alpha/beta hydrolase [Methylobacterium planeticum]KAB1076082.1 alpha/beta hydrolase [Methylobacterium planeticum]
MRIMALGALAIALLYALALGALAAFQRHLIYPGAYATRAQRPADRAASPGIAAASVRTRDGESLFALWRAPRPGCGVVLTFHGNGSRPEPHAARFASGAWAAGGWGVLAIAYRGYAGSSGSPSEAGLIADGIAAYLEAGRRAPGAPILLHGHSLGAAVAVAVAERAPHLGLYLEAPFDSMAALVRLRVPLAPGLLLRDTYRSDLRIARTAEPVLIVHGLADTIVPVKLAHRLAAAAGPSARLEVLAGDHVSILGARDAAAEPFFRARIGEGCEARAAALAR